jgi:probable phosphoglycerate mutase
MRLLFARHGESLANTQHLISNRDLPHPLTGKGREQAAALAETLAKRPIQRIYTSPVLRARETAGIIARRLAVPLELTEALKEYDCGSLEGRGDEAAWAAHAQFVHDWLDGKNWDRAPEGGETFFDIQRRVAGFVHELAAGSTAEEGEILCISHGGTLLFGLPGLLTNLPLAWLRERRLGHTELVAAETQQDRLVCRSWGAHQFNCEP